VSSLRYAKAAGHTLRATLLRDTFLYAQIRLAPHVRSGSMACRYHGFGHLYRIIDALLACRFGKAQQEQGKAGIVHQTAAVGQPRLRQSIGKLRADALRVVQKCADLIERHTQLRIAAKRLAQCRLGLGRVVGILNPALHLVRGVGLD